MRTSSLAHKGKKQMKYNNNGGSTCCQKISKISKKKSGPGKMVNSIDSDNLTDNQTKYIKTKIKK